VVTRSRRRNWEGAAPDDWAAHLHLLYLRHRDAYQPAYFARSGRYPMPRPGLARAWRWFVADVALQSLRLVRRNGPAVRAVAGVPAWRQLGQMVRLAVALPAMPENYYKFEWYRPANRARAGDYLHRHETKGGLYEMLGDTAELAAVAPLNDKVAFAEHAGRAGLPVVETLAVVADGLVRGTPDLPANDVFVKPVTGRGGRQVRRWHYLPEADGFHAADVPEAVPRGYLVSRLAAEASGPVLVQPCLVNHPDLADVALDALVTCRLVTILDESGEPEPVIAIFRMPAVRGAVVDNMHRGGVAAPVDIESGALGAATGYAVAGPAARHTGHPVTGASIAGRKLPLWEEVLTLATRAHHAFLPRVLVGWDIAICPTGPVLVEGNEQPGVDGLQRLHDQPLGSHRFGRLLAHHLARLT
jgi:hypothetical protein